MVLSKNVNHACMQNVPVISGLSPVVGADSLIPCAPPRNNKH